jgi:hypothetical protein
VAYYDCGRSTSARSLIRAARWCFAVQAAVHVCLLGSGCADQSGLERASRATVYGADDRREVMQADDTWVRVVARDSLVAITRRGATLDATQTLAKKHGLCADAPFAGQPVLAVCAGILVRPDLVLTAGHCADELSCAGMDVVRGFYYRGRPEDGLQTLETFRCREIAAIAVDPPSNPRQEDYAWVRLDRAANTTARVVLARSDEGELLGQEVTTVGFPGGIPAKWTRGRVFDAGSSERRFFVSSLDTFHGNSGSPVFNERDQLIGVLARGEPDLIRTEDACFAVARRTEDAPSAGEEATHIGAAVAGLCRTGGRTDDLCNIPAPDVGGGCRAAGAVDRQSATSWSAAALVSVLLIVLTASRLRKRSSATDLPPDHS